MIGEKVIKLSDYEQTVMELKSLRLNEKSQYWRAAIDEAIQLIRQQKAEVEALKQMLSALSSQPQKGE